MYKFSAGIVAADGVLIRQEDLDGIGFESNRIDKGIYRLFFNESLGPNIILIASSEGGERGAWMHIIKASGREAILHARDYAGHGSADTEFHFYAIGSVRN